MKNLRKMLKLLISIILISFLVVFHTQTFASGLVDGTKDFKDKIDDGFKQVTNQPDETEDAQTTTDSKSLSDIVNAGSEWINQGKKANEGNTNTSITMFASQFVGIGQVLVAIGVVTLLIVAAIMAVKWITATPDKQAKLKQQLVGLVIAAVVIFGAVGIWSLIKGILEDVETELGVTQAIIIYNDNESISSKNI